MEPEELVGAVSDRRPTARGRVVMLVDNDVERDSRVQKQARSMAERGWDVTLLGRSLTSHPRRWRLGNAAVRLLPVPMNLARRPQDLRRARLRAPLAYPMGWMADRRRQALKAWQADLRVRRIATRQPGRGPLLRRAVQAGLLPSRAAALLAGRWVNLRASQTQQLVERRERMDTPVDRFTTAFWQRAMGDRAWRRLDPNLWDYELAYGPVVDRLRPDLIHANDFRMLGVAARAVMRAREQSREVKLVWDAHEFLPGIKPWNDHPRWHVAQCAHEREYAGEADAVVTVSEELADLLAETHSLRSCPTVVLNAPYAQHEAEAGPAPSIRAMCEVGPQVPIMVYSGVATPQRGLDIMIEALPQFDGLICALVVARPESEYVRSLVARANVLGVSDRLRLLPYVPFDQVVPFLSSADVGVIPINHWPNHEIALITKFFEYSHACLPMVVSDVRAMADMTRSTGQGEVFEAENLPDFVAAVRKVLEKPQKYREAYTPDLLHQWTWEAQAEILDGVYEGLLRVRKR